MKKKGTEIPILFMTGYAASEEELEASVIRKPFTSSDLINALQTVQQSVDIDQLKS